MNHTRVNNAGFTRPLQRGYSMIELSVAMVIALFLLNGMFMILQGTRRTSTNQNLLAQLQDEERTAMTMITDVIQQAGYYPNPQLSDPTLTFLPSATFTTAGQTVFGVANAPYGDKVSLRYQGDASNTVLDCRGNLMANGAVTEMTYFVQLGPNNTPELFCNVNGVSVPLVPNVQSVAVSYGVDVNGSGSANAYLPAAQMAPYWTSVYSVKITVNFTNPLFGQPGQNTKPTIPFTRVIGIMSRLGVNVLNFYN
jgi:type IV pilus assembly protein PilW